jgi:hypothetical protein
MHITNTISNALTIFLFVKKLISLPCYQV